MIYGEAQDRYKGVKLPREGEINQQQRTALNDYRDKRTWGGFLFRETLELRPICIV